MKGPHRVRIVWALIASAPLVLACQGSLEGTFPARMGHGSGGSGSGGSGTGGSGSGGSGPGTGGSSGNCDAVAMVLKPTCAVMFCHDGPTGTPPNLAAADLPTLVKTTKADALCAGELLADPANPTASVLYKVIANRDCGDQMPAGVPFEGDQLTSALACMADWIGHL